MPHRAESRLSKTKQTLTDLNYRAPHISKYTGHCALYGVAARLADTQRGVDPVKRH